ncbi:protein of unknown function (plasmid) [Pararobbsia alpina]|uniref:hypothetical protein n=1 Tax=Pararobbsia alpina TaxID=621374 RepID=UPI0039A6C54B
MSDQPSFVTVDQVLADRSASSWLKRAVIDLLQRDPVDAANDAEVLSALMAHRADELLSRADAQPFDKS